MKQEMLINPDDVAVGHMVKFRPVPREQIVRSREQAHPEVITVDTFTDVQLLRRSKAAGGLAGSRRQERDQKNTKRVYLLRGRVRCGYCERRMEGTPRQDRI